MLEGQAADPQVPCSPGDEGQQRERVTCGVEPGAKEALGAHSKPIHSCQEHLSLPVRMSSTESEKAWIHSKLLHSP